MSIIPSLIGQKFGRLTVVDGPLKDHNNDTVWECVCICGSMRQLFGRTLRSGNTKSCGCLARDLSKQRYTTYNKKDNLKLFARWSRMRQRCTNKKLREYPYYGGKGVTVCKEWQESFVSFRDWALTNGYADDLTIDRIDVNGNYEPSNCRWVSMAVQMNNMTTNRMITAFGVTKSMADWSRDERCNVTYQCLSSRIRVQKMESELALTLPKKSQGRVSACRKAREEPR